MSAADDRSRESLCERCGSDAAGENERNCLQELTEIDGVFVITIDADCCGAAGCRATATLWHVDVAAGRSRTLCPGCAVEFVAREVRQ